MLLSEFDYTLPDELIASKPMKNREKSKMLTLNKRAKTIEHKNFSDIVNLLDENDVLVLNDTRVIPARLYTQKETGSKVEIFLLKQHENKNWEALIKPSKRIKTGLVFNIDDQLQIEVIESFGEGKWLIKPKHTGDIYDVLAKIGNIPLPPYIEKNLDEQELKSMDFERYQTVYGKHLGSVAASTAGLHFTLEILEQLKAKGVQVCYVTLNVGLGTFKPVKCDNISEHKMDSESFTVTELTANIINEAKQKGKNIVAVGTTAVRTLETTFAKYGCIESVQDASELFIYPGFKYKVVDKMITNFHLPKSTLIMLVSAFAGKDFVFEAYQKAIEEKYRFYSFGDCCFIF